VKKRRRRRTRVNRGIDYLLYLTALPSFFTSLSVVCSFCPPLSDLTHLAFL
jgi:hypothetical protein